MSNILLRDDTSKIERSRTILAKKGIIQKENDKNSTFTEVIIFDGATENRKIKMKQSESREIFCCKCEQYATVRLGNSACLRVISKEIGVFCALHTLWGQNPNV